MGTQERHRCTCFTLARSASGRLPHGWVPRSATGAHGSRLPGQLQGGFHMDGYQEAPQVRMVHACQVSFRAASTPASARTLQINSSNGVWSASEIETDQTRDTYTNICI
eukprot:332384-Chlamydomonas_euryale.AAC.3